MEHELYTIGYAGKKIDYFISCLKKNGITCLIDVRTSPFSKTFPEYDKPRLKEVLNQNGILYAHFGNEFGARRVEPEAYIKTYNLKGEAIEQVSFNNVYRLPEFQKGVERVIKALEQGYRVCFMCSEKHPVDCHRFWMVGLYFNFLSMSFDVINIIDEDKNQSIAEVFEECEYEKDKAKFYKEHEDELNPTSLFQLDVPKWVEKWDEIFGSNEHIDLKKQTYSNIKIGYCKGNEEDD